VVSSYSADSYAYPNAISAMEGHLYGKVITVNVRAFWREIVIGWAFIVSLEAIARAIFIEEMVNQMRNLDYQMKELRLVVAKLGFNCAQ